MAKKKASTKQLVSLIVVVAAIVVALIAAIVTVLNSYPEAPEVHVEALTEEDKKATEETSKDYEITFKGYEKFTENDREYDAVTIDVTSTSDKEINLAIEIVGKNASGKIFAHTGLYAENMMPGEVYTFHAFRNAGLLPAQLKNATYEVYKSYTYEPNDILEESD